MRPGSHVPRAADVLACVGARISVSEVRTWVCDSHGQRKTVDALHAVHLRARRSEVLRPKNANQQRATW